MRNPEDILQLKYQNIQSVHNLIWTKTYSLDHEDFTRIRSLNLRMKKRLQNTDECYLEINRVDTIDETWIQFYYPKANQISME